MCQKLSTKFLKQQCGTEWKAAYVAGVLQVGEPGAFVASDRPASEALLPLEVWEDVTHIHQLQSALALSEHLHSHSLPLQLP